MGSNCTDIHQLQKRLKQKDNLNFNEKLKNNKECIINKKLNEKKRSNQKPLIVTNLEKRKESSINRSRFSTKNLGNQVGETARLDEANENRQVILLKFQNLRKVAKGNILKLSLCFL